MYTGKVFDIMRFITEFCSFSPRLGKNEKIAADYLKNILEENQVDFISQEFNAIIPEWKKSELFADGVRIDCRNTSLVSGKILGNDYIIDPFGELDEEIPYDINFSKFTDSVCTISFYDHPSLAVSRKDIEKVRNAKEVFGEAVVEKVDHVSENIIVGNILNPEVIVFTHYDSLLSGGALDNASGVAVALAAITENPNVLYKVLFVFSGCEEISYDIHDMSGLGYRVFEESYGNIIRNCKKLIILDGLGRGKPSFSQDPYMLSITLQLKMLDDVKEKTYLMQCEEEKILEVYHSDDDTPDKLIEEDLRDSVKLLNYIILN